MRRSGTRLLFRGGLILRYRKRRVRNAGHNRRHGGHDKAKEGAACGGSYPQRRRYHGDSGGKIIVLINELERDNIGVGGMLLTDRV